jgi:hypothetical protein
MSRVLRQPASDRERVGDDDARTHRGRLGQWL